MIIESDIEEYGFAIVPDVIDGDTIADLLQELQQEEPQKSSHAGQGMYALRNLFQTIPNIRTLAMSRPVQTLVEPFFGADCFAVRAIYFDKLPNANWKVPWHQDLSVALTAQRDCAGFGPWSQKAGVAHAQAPVSLLEGMLTIRLHLDACYKENGPLRVLPGTHRYGKLNPTQIESLRSQVEEVVCEVGSGGALLMRPLLLHASAAAQIPNHRRVIHMEYANTRLPDGLEWHEKVLSGTGQLSSSALSLLKCGR